jgi:hypothetical protein
MNAGCFEVGERGRRFGGVREGVKVVAKELYVT